MEDNKKEYIVSLTKEFIVTGNNKKEVLEHYEEEFKSGLNYSCSVEVNKA
tara:strand:- start:1405 stop:1554 length:150 start_codon:yes stop_codon:yes gene_type:complete